MCGEGDLLKIAKEYNIKQNAQISSLNSNENNLKKDFNDVLNLAKNAYFALEQSKLKGFSNILKSIKNTNIELADEYKKIFEETYIPNIDEKLIEKEKNAEPKEILFMLFELISKFFYLIFDSNLLNLKKNIDDYLNIIKEILIKIY